MHKVFVMKNKASICCYYIQYAVNIGYRSKQKLFVIREAFLFLSSLPNQVLKQLWKKNINLCQTDNNIMT